MWQLDTGWRLRDLNAGGATQTGPQAHQTSSINGAAPFPKVQPPPPPTAGLLTTLSSPFGPLSACPGKLWATYFSKGGRIHKSSSQCIFRVVQCKVQYMPCRYRGGSRGVAPLGFNRCARWRYVSTLSSGPSYRERNCVSFEVKAAWVPWPFLQLCQSVFPTPTFSTPQFTLYIEYSTSALQSSTASSFKPRALVSVSIFVT